MADITGTVNFPRRLIALVYDVIAATTVVYFAAFVPVLLRGAAIAPGNPLLALYLVAVWFGYFGLCWTRGATLGMQAWKLVIESTDGAPRVSWGRAALRFAAAAVALAPCGAGYLATLFDRDGRAWHDRWSHTRLRRRLSASAVRE